MRGPPCASLHVLGMAEESLLLQLSPRAKLRSWGRKGARGLVVNKVEHLRVLYAVPPKQQQARGKTIQTPQQNSMVVVGLEKEVHL